MSVEKIEMEVNIPEGYTILSRKCAIHGELYLTSSGMAARWVGAPSLGKRIILKRIDEASGKEPKVPHKHADLIKAWADGATIQFKNNLIPGGKWMDCPNNQPLWSDSDIYRIKPDKKVIRFRNWLMKSGDIVTWQLGQGICCPDGTPNFVSWVGGWKQIEVEVDK